LKISYTILFIFLISACFGQQPVKKDSVKRDTVKNRYLPTGFRLGVDALALVKSSTQNNFSGWEVNADVDFHRYFLAFDYGTWARTFLDDSSTYRNDGKYWRVGVDVNFLKKDPDRNMFFIGMRYGRATFSEDLSIIAFDPRIGWSSLLAFV